MAMYNMIYVEKSKYFLKYVTIRIKYVTIWIQIGCVFIDFLFKLKINRNMDNNII